LCVKENEEFVPVTDMSNDYYKLMKRPKQGPDLERIYENNYILSFY